MFVFAPQAPDSFPDLMGQVAHGVGAVVGQVRVGKIGPHVLDRIEFGRVGREKLRPEPVRLGFKELPCPLAPMGGEAVPEEDRLAWEVASQVTQKADHPFAGHAPFQKGKKQPDLATSRRGGQSAHRREAFPVERKAQDGRVAAGRPGAANAGTLRKAALVEEN